MAPKKEPRQDGQEDQVEDLSPQEEKTGFSHCDLHLLESGEHADVKLMCAGRVFNCHRAILAARSGWFADKIFDLSQLSLPQDGSLPMVHIQVPGPDEIEAVLVFIYAGEVDPRATDHFGEPTESAIQAYIRLFNLGHDFRVTGLPDFASDALGKSLSHTLQMICDLRLTNRQLTNGRTELQDRLRNSDFIRAYLDGLDAANWVRSRGADEKERVRPWQMLVDFFIAGKEVLLQEPEIALFLEDDSIPSFAKSVLLTERRTGHCQSKWMCGLVVRPPKNKPGRKGMCWDCGGGLKNIKETGGIALVNPRSKEISYSQACCVKCAEKESNIGTDGLPFKWEMFDAKKP